MNVDNVAVDEAVKNVVNNINNENKDGVYPDNGDSNNAEEAYHDFDENGVKVENTGFRKAVVPDFRGPTNDRQNAVVAAFQHAWSGYKKFAWGHDHLRCVLHSLHRSSPIKEDFVNILIYYIVRKNWNLHLDLGLIIVWCVSGFSIWNFFN